MKLLYFCLLLVVIWLSSECHCYRFLGIFIFQAKSHFVMFEALMKGLADKGHQVDVISAFPQKKPYNNYTDLIVIPPTLELVNNLSYDLMLSLIGGLPVHAVATMGGNDVCEYLSHPDIEKLIHHPPKDPPYDLVLIEIFGASCYAVLGYLLNVPVVGVSSSVLYPWSNGIISNPENLAFVPNNVLAITGKMNFWQRIYNTASTTFNKIYFNYVTKVQDDQLKRYVGPNLPSVRELESNISIILVNSHIALNDIRPMTPAMIEIGGLHIKDDDTQLSTELLKWMNESRDGIVYFSFGSMVKIESFPRRILDIFYKSLKKIAPVRVLMKIANPKELPPGLPSNVHTASWLQQIKVLKHPNVKAFITHGGLMGTQESVACAIPMIGIPLFADQFVNIANYVSKNIAIKLDVGTMTEEDMDNALNEILYNPIYKETIQKISVKFLDRPLKPIDMAFYWIEYIIKHGKDALRSPAMELSWWKIALLDVYSFVLIIIIVTIFILVQLAYFILGLILPNQGVHVSSMKKIS